MKIIKNSTKDNIQFRDIGYGMVFMYMHDGRYYIRINDEDCDMLINAVCLTDGTTKYIGNIEAVHIVEATLTVED